MAPGWRPRLVLRPALPRVALASSNGRIGQRAGISGRQLHVDHRNRLTQFWVPPPQVALKDAKQNEESHAKLVRAGFFRQAHSGVFHMLPLGLRVQDKIEALVDKHMRSIGASRVALSSITSAGLWERSGRLGSVKPELFQFEDRKQAKFLLAPTHEEEITELVAQSVHSYRDLPLRLYQITRKYRDEMRPRYGILRSREFIMKDLYTFDTTVEAALATYEQVRAAYAAIFAELRVPVRVARASSGDMGGDLSHEYHLAASLGEDDVASCRACGFAGNTEITHIGPDSRPARSGDDCPDCGAAGSLQVERAIELGHTFYLGTRYSEPLNVRVQGDQNTPATSTITPLMGCYGIGISRILGAVADHLADPTGLRWPRAIAPFEVAVVAAGGSPLAQVAERVYDELTANTETRLDALLDDRPAASLPYKLKDADLTGYPVVVIVGAAWRRSTATATDSSAPNISLDGLCEVQCRQLGLRQDVPLSELKTFVSGLLAQL
ncbi:prolyl-tRNA synthetase [Grosmannia clavigera kw1407]|uniref:proline--tRNA ligase n=1 Tax=Grosmannia clavigera (strain kw1407 / UAMH 11150) TaxID=655863 RepID=F0X9C0_GROCL|nr:prolyl-tRNA synthetase [Grosmannia clavigera kw1407]EFX06114.1 prolyl-tRNA synthetase [Grosmannia clavigera kw1407]